ncbi:MAG: hypothetical protein AABZ12_03455, partial [Planctomycetota bacterium]
MRSLRGTGTRGRATQSSAFTLAEVGFALASLAALLGVIVPSVTSSRLGSERDRPAQSNESRRQQSDSTAETRAQDGSVIPSVETLLPRQNDRAGLRAGATSKDGSVDLTLGLNRSTTAEAPEHVRALHLETMQENATLDNQPGQVAGGPPHDDCPSCMPIATGQTISNTNFGATPWILTHGYCADNDYTDVWHCWTSPCDGTATISLCGTGTTFDTTLDVYRSCDVRTFPALACDDDGCTGVAGPSRLTMNVTGGVPYFIRVAGYNGAVGQYSLKVDLTCGALPEACCFPNGECLDESPSGCREGLGTPQGPGTVCNVNTFCAGPNTGGCCFGDQCSILSLSACMAGRGIYIGDGVPCRPDVCLGQCCMRDALCAYTTPEKCFNEGGIFWNVFDDCDPNDCPQTGACCTPSGGCLETSKAICEGNGGRFIDEGTNCSATICAPPTEACCFATGGCQDMSRAACQESLGTPQGPGTFCATVFCVLPPQACCTPSGGCFDVDPPTCDIEFQGTPQGLGTSCATVVCPQPTEACCSATGGCQDRLPVVCLKFGGAPQGPGTSCATAQCPLPTGACCAPPQACTVGGSCEAFPGCGGSFNCFCFDTAEGGLDCTRDFPCSTALPCPNGTSSCPAGQVCYVNTCCGIPVCGPPGCLTATADAGTPVSEMGQGELTASGAPPLNVAAAGECIEVDAPTCQALGGLYQGDLTQCSLTTCPLPSGACCNVDGCFITDRATCSSGGARYLGDGTVCTPTTCQPPEACCFVDVACADLLAGLCTALCPCAPDMNCDGSVNAGDSDAFVLALTDPAGYQAQYPNCNLSAADLNCDGTVNGLDLPLFYCVIGRVCEDLAPGTCANQLGAPQGPGSTCANTNCVPLPTTEACCLPGGGCEPTTPAVCRRIDGFPQGPGTQCAGDLNGDGIDDACAAAPCAECGPEQHWIHNPPCPPGGFGQDTLPSGAYAGIDTNGDCIADINFVLGGPVTIRKKGPRDDSAQYPGLRPIDGHLDVIDTEILSMSLTGGGMTLTAGGGLGTFPLQGSTGAIAEDPTDPFVADSFFDVFFEITDGLGLLAYNRTPIRVATRIDCLPPDGIYAHITGCTPLFSSPSPTGGTFVGNLVSANHFTYPGCCFGTQCQRDVPTQICQERQGTVVPDCLGDLDGDAIDDACECGPTPDGSGCRQSTCPSLIELCQPRCVTFNPTTGRTTVTACDCAGTGECHVQVSPPTSVAGLSGCVVPDNGSGTVTLPPAGCDYLSPDDVHRIIDGLPPGTTIELAAIHKEFICRQPGTPGSICSFVPDIDCSELGGTLDGEKECVQSTLQLNLRGTGDLNGFNRMVNLPVSFETHTAPRMPGDPVQSFDTDMFRLFGQFTGDPDFDLLRVVGGTDFGLPSPGHTTLIRMPGGNWAVDSFFDITYRIDFVGAPGGALAGRSGSTTATIRMQTAPSIGPICLGGCTDGNVCKPTRTVNPDGSITLCCDCARPTTVEVDFFPNTSALMELQMPNGDSVPIALSGPTTVHVFFEGANEGDAGDQDGDGLDEVQTEMVDMQLAGNSPFGPVLVRLHPGKPSRGEIEETANTQPGRLDLPPFAPAGTASSFFDVFFEIQIGDRKFHTQIPKRMSSVIDHKPPGPGTSYENPEKIPLLDENGNPTDFSIGAGRHVPKP